VDAVDADMIFTAKGGDVQIDPLGSVLLRLGFEIFDRPALGRQGFVVKPQKARVAILLTKFGGAALPILGMCSALIPFLSASVFRCLGPATIVASMICPPMARKPAFVSAASKSLNRTSMADLPSIIDLVNASRKFQIELASVTLWANHTPRKRMNDRRPLITHFVLSSD